MIIDNCYAKFKEIREPIKEDDLIVSLFLKI
jgi:cystathionine beta-lyase family protein involved in aluminum resistance